MIKAVLASLDGLPEPVAAEYTKADDGKFYLNIEGLDTDAHPAVKGLRTALGKQTDERKQLATALAAALEDAKKIKGDYETLNSEMEKRLEGALPKADAEALRKSFTDKIGRVSTEKDTEIAKRDSVIEKILVRDTARALAEGLVVDKLFIGTMLPHIQSRLVVEMTGGDAVTRVLDPAGKPSAATIADLRQEFIDNPAFAPMLRGSKASGAGANGGPSGGGPPAPVIKEMGKTTDYKALAAALKPKVEGA